MEQTMQIRKVRDFSQVLTASVSFIKEHLFPLGKMLLSIIIPFAILGQLLDIPQPVLAIPAFMQASDGFTQYFCAFLVTGYVYCYLVLFQEKKSIPKPIDIWRLLFGRSLSLLLGFALAITIVVIGFFFMFIPGIYFLGVFSLLSVIIIAERKGGFEAFGRCFELVAQEWWGTMGIYVITMYFSIVYAYGIGLPLELLVSIMQGNSIFTPQVEGVGHVINRINFFLTFVSSQLLGAIPAVALGLQYYSIVEKREMVGLVERLSELTQTEQASK